MKDVLIITFYNAPNYGAYLQAYAMQHFLENKKCNAYIYAHDANNLSSFSKLLELLKIKQHSIYEDRLRVVIDHECNRLNLCKSPSRKFDLAILGSDEIWNIKNPTAKHSSFFFSRWKTATKTISYAACAGSTKYHLLSLFPFSYGLKKLDSISVRDTSTKETIERLTHSKAEIVLDPTFLYPFYQDIPGRLIDEPYLFLYTYGLTEKSIKLIKDFATKESLRIIATGSECNFCDNNPVPGPFEWLSLIKNSKYVITSTFHGSVFSILLKKNFVVLENNSEKVRELLGRFQLTSRLIINESEFECTLKSDINYSDVDGLIDLDTTRSAEFILNHLKD